MVRILDWKECSRIERIFLGIYGALSLVGLVMFCVYGYSWTKILRYGLLLLFLAYLGWCDIRTQTIPNAGILAALACRTILLLLELFLYRSDWEALVFQFGAGLLVMFALLFTAAFLSRGSLGMGDVKLGAVIGYYTGVRYGFMSLIMGLLCCMMVCIVQMIRRRMNLKSSIAFGPFLAIGTLLVLVMGF